MKRLAVVIMADQIRNKAEAHRVARYLSFLTGVPHEVDHIIPRCEWHPSFGNVNAADNLQVLTREANNIKAQNEGWRNKLARRRRKRRENNAKV